MYIYIQNHLHRLTLMHTLQRFEQHVQGIICNILVKLKNIYKDATGVYQIFQTHSLIIEQ